AYRAKPTRKKVLEERQLIHIAVAVRIAQTRMQTQRETPCQRLEHLGFIIQLVILQVTARQRNFRRQPLRCTTVGQDATVKSGFAPEQAGGDVLKMVTVFINKTLLCNDIQIGRASCRERV